MLFHQPEFLPIAYFVVLMWVVCAGVAAKFLAPLLVDSSSGDLRRLLSMPLNVRMTGDAFASDVFEKQLLADVNARILLQLLPNLIKLANYHPLPPISHHVFSVRAQFFPEKYWSGCPPKAA